ncbi:MAG: histidine kinase dimerization/phospho-acceptor domain-containing protein [Pseudomonadota bacterium]
MIVDDRLETVLRTSVAGKTAGRTQMRQLVDLLGVVPLAAWTTRHADALERLDSLASALSDEECASVLRATSHRSAVLVYHFAQGGPRTASAVIASARLPEDDWLALIPRLPTRARGFLRHRTDLGERVRETLSRLGINDFLLPEPEGAVPVEVSIMAPAEAVAEQPAPDVLKLAEPLAAPNAISASGPSSPLDEGIGAIVRRIEAFRRKREERDATVQAPRADGLAPLLPFGDEQAPARPPALSIDLRTDADGVVVHAAIDPAGMLIGTRLFVPDQGAAVHCNDAMAAAFRLRQPISAGQLAIEGADHVSGFWQADGTPCFARDGGRFSGYLIRLRRPLQLATDSVSQAPNPHGDADRLRQLLHELRTPINAIQGFAEVIQQQVFGATPHQYRAMAASIASDAAQMLAGFEEVERLVKLESQTLDIERGEADAAEIIARLVEQISPVLGARNVRLTVAMPPQPVPVAFAADEIERSVWRILTVIAASVAPGERLSITLEIQGAAAILALTLPASLQRLDDAALFAPDAGGSGGPFAASAMLGNGFALRLARAEFQAGNGSLLREGDRIMASLPHLTAGNQQLTPSPSDNRSVAG